MSRTVCRCGWSPPCDLHPSPDATVLEAAERWERSRSAVEGRGLLPLAVIEEWHQACVALAAAVRARLATGCWAVGER